jgi:single-stranded DNA-binding protein
MQLHIVDGRLGKDAEVKADKNGRNYARFSLANRVFKNGEEETVWYDVISYDETVVTKQAPHMKKGSYVIVTGVLYVETRTVNSTIYTNLLLRASKVDFVNTGSKPEDSNTTVTTQATPQPTVTEAPSVAFTAQVPVDAVASNSVSLTDESEDDLPF